MRVWLVATEVDDVVLGLPGLGDVADGAVDVLPLGNDAFCLPGFLAPDPPGHLPGANLPLGHDISPWLVGLSSW